MEKKDCDNCKLLALMTGLLKDSNDAVKKLKEENARLRAGTQIKIDFNPN